MMVLNISHKDKFQDHVSRRVIVSEMMVMLECRLYILDI